MTIAEVSKTFGLTADTLRYYERIGLIPRSSAAAAVFVIMMKKIVIG